jgi:hypothetical protein
MRRLLAIAVLFGASFSAPAAMCDPNALREQLLKRNATDQAARKALMAAPQSKAELDTALRVDADNTAFMRQVLAKCGWPKKSVVGAEAAKSAWRLTQHADMDPQYQVLADQPQVYGMQFYSAADGAIEFYDIVSPGRLDERRKEIGLQPFFCWALRVSKMSQVAAIRWPAGVLVSPSECSDAP